MGKGYLRMRTDSISSDLLNADFQELGAAAKKLGTHAIGSIQLGISLGFGSTFLQWVACIAAIYLLVLDRTNWKTKILTGLLIPYIFLTCPDWLFSICRGEIGRWIAFIAVIIRLFFPQRFPQVKEWMELPAACIILVVVAPSLFATTVRDGWIGVVICLVIAAYLLQEHIRASGGFKNAFSQPHGWSNTIGIICLFVYPVWALILIIL